jgi:hypothetical protein
MINEERLEVSDEVKMTDNAPGLSASHSLGDQAWRRGNTRSDTGAFVL